MTVYLCAVSPRFPENYEIGVQANKWGVEEKYRRRIEPVNPGDLLVFLLGSSFRSVHRIESKVFFEETELWPRKDGSLYPYRVRLSDPIYKGAVPLSEVAESIAFMKGMQPRLPTQGAKGVFNDRLTQAELDIIQQRMTAPTSPPPVPIRRTEQEKAAAERIEVLFKFYEKDVEEPVLRLLPELQLRLYTDHASGKTGHQYPCAAGRIDFLCVDNTTEDYVVLELKRGLAPKETLLQVLRYMSWVRQNLAGKRGVRGTILTESADSSLMDLVSEVPGVDIRYYRIGLTLVERPGPSLS